MTSPTGLPYASVNMPAGMVITASPLSTPTGGVYFMLANPPLVFGLSKFNVPPPVTDMFPA